MSDEKKPIAKNGPEDDSYVLEDTGNSVEDIEHEMEIAAQEAADSTAARRAREIVPGQASAESDDMKDRYLRTLADFENFRKRTEREKADFYKYALSGLVRELLPVLDNFDRALEHAEEGDDFHKGVLMIYKQLYGVLEKYGLKPIDDSGVPFDPKIHEAVVREDDPSVPSHTVVAVLQKGYFIHERLLRPAMVKVAVGGPEEQR
ncbi:MAG TPA: nucleotide exchange factor GrpE [Thermoanaerobaculia bacterium]|nr:nucleotide exchange factor GrpE [Thermoanaerobaculia bacterium]